MPNRASMPNREPEEILEATLDILATSSPMTVQTMGQALRARGIVVDDGEEWFESLLDEFDPLIMPVGDDTYAWLPKLLRGRTFTRRLTDTETSNDLLLTSEDLSVLEFLVDDPPYDRLTDGTRVTMVFPEDHDLLEERGIRTELVSGGAICLEPGTLARRGVGVGGLVGIRVEADGLVLSAVADASGSDAAEAVARLVAQSPDRARSLEASLWEACAHDDALFRTPGAPIGEQLEQAGVARRGALVAVEGFDFDARDTLDRLDDIKEAYDLYEDEALAVLTLLSVHEEVAFVVEDALEANPLNERHSGSSSVAAGLSDQAVESSLRLLADPAVARAFLTEALMGADFEDEYVAATALAIMAQALEAQARRSGRVALRWLRGMAQEALGRVQDAEETLRGAEALDPTWEPVLLSLARYASDRGDAVRGLSLLRRAGAEDEPLFELLLAFQPQTGSELPRNSPCWCGSGRKYKQCHMRPAALPLEERAAWLYQKSSHDLTSGQYLPLLYELASERSRYWGDSDEAFGRAVSDALVADVMLFEGGAFEDFVQTRGALLPPDEALTAQQWLLAERSLFEVTAVRPAESLTVRDVRTGDVIEVRERTASRTVKTGQYYCMRVVPAGETMQIFGGMEPVSLMERAPLMALLDDEDTDPAELVAFLSRRFAPPIIQNTEGEAMVLCEATIRITRPKAVPAYLDERFGAAQEGPAGERTWFEHVVTKGIEQIRAEFALVGRELRVSANSVSRFERALAAVRDADPSSKVLEDKREPAPDMTPPKRAGGKGGSPFGLAGASSSPVPDPAMEPEIAAALEGMILTYEQKWLDESIPALGGRTPRECASDPTRREDLIRLLDTFPEDGGLGAMSPARLRAALGLD